MTTITTFGDRVARSREMRGWSQKEASAITGVSVTFISEIENDHREPGMAVLRALSAHYGVSLDWLVHGPRAEP